MTSEQRPDVEAWRYGENDPAPAPLCRHDIGDPPNSCRCLLPRGHDGLHECVHTTTQAATS